MVPHAYAVHVDDECIDESKEVGQRRSATSAYASGHMALEIGRQSNGTSIPTLAIAIVVSGFYKLPNVGTLYLFQVPVNTGVLGGLYNVPGCSEVYTKNKVQRETSGDGLDVRHHACYPEKAWVMTCQ